MNARMLQAQAGARMLQAPLSDPRYILPKAQKAADAKAGGDAKAEGAGAAPKEAWPGWRLHKPQGYWAPKIGMTWLFYILLLVVLGNRVISPVFGRSIWALVAEPIGSHLKGRV